MGIAVLRKRKGEVSSWANSNVGWAMPKFLNHNLHSLIYLIGPSYLDVSAEEVAVKV
jgi:hypothetical protein